MKKPYKIRIEHKKHLHEFRIELLQLKRWWIFSWYENMAIRHGRYSTIEHYIHLWCKEFDIYSEDIIKDF